MMEKKKKRKKITEKPAETVKPKPKPETAPTSQAPPPKAKFEEVPMPPAPLPKPKREMNVAEETYEYLRKHGATSPLRIARDLNLNPLTVMKALKELEKQGRIHVNH